MERPQGADPFQRELRARLRSIAEASNQQRAADLLNVSVATISRIIDGKQLAGYSLARRVVALWPEMLDLLGPEQSRRRKAS